MLRFIRDEPAITRMELAKRAHVSRASARHHLRILADERLVTELAGTRNPAYVLHAGTAQADDFPHGAVQSLTALAHETRRQILIAASPSVDHESFSAQRPVSKATFSEHCSILEAAGLLQRQANGRHVQWLARIPLRTIRASILAAFLQQHQRHLSPDIQRYLLCNEGLHE